MWKLGRLWALFRRDLPLVWALLRDPRAPASSKAVAILAILYVLSPVDLVSDLIPVLGWIDDGVVAVLLLRLAMRFLPEDVHAALKARLDQRAGAAR